MFKIIYLPVEAAMAPIITAGMAIIMQPNPAAIDKPTARPPVFCDNTRWKYACGYDVHNPE